MKESTISVKEAKSPERIGWADLARGIAILLVIIGHTLEFDDFTSIYIRGMIFSFHMPLFFILGAFTYRWAQDKTSLMEKTKRGARHLLIPVVLIWLLQLAFFWSDQGKSIELTEYLRDALKRLLFSSGASITHDSETIAPLGMLWFLVVLFLGRLLYNSVKLLFEEKQQIFISLLLGFLGILSEALPFSGDIVLAVQPFFWLGDRMSRSAYWKEKRESRYFIPAFLLWIVTLFVMFPEHLELATRSYPLFPLFYLCAAGGSLFIFELCRGLAALPFRIIPLEFIGKYSLYFLLVHSIDTFFFGSFLWRDEKNFAFSCLFRILYVTAGAVLLIFMKKMAGRIGRVLRRKG